MKKVFYLVVSAFSLSFFTLVFCPQVSAQGAESPQAAAFSGNISLLSHWNWRGISYSGASFQPEAAVALGNWSIGLWSTLGWTPDYNNLMAEVDFIVNYSISPAFSVGSTTYWSSGAQDEFYFIPMDSWVTDLSASFHSTFFTASWYTSVLNDPSYLSFVEITGNYPVGTWNFSLTGGFVPYTGATADNMYLAQGFTFTQLELGIEKAFQINSSYSIPVLLSFGYNPNVQQIYYGLKVTF